MRVMEHAKNALTWPFPEELVGSVPPLANAPQRAVCLVFTMPPMRVQASAASLAHQFRSLEERVPSAFQMAHAHRWIVMLAASSKITPARYART